MSCSANTDENLDKVSQNISELKSQGAQIICLQELFSNLYFCQHVSKEPFALAEPLNGKICQFLARQAKQHQVILIGSVFEKSSESDFYNTAVVYDENGNLLGSYRKHHIPDDAHNNYAEMDFFKPGNDGYPIFETSIGKIGVLVCWDQWFPEAARILASQGAEIIFYPTAIGWPLHGKETFNGKAERDAWITIQRSHAIANGVFVAAVNRVQTEDQLEFWGGSFVADPIGHVLDQADDKSETNLCVEIDLSRIAAVKHDWPLLECRRVDSYQKLLD